MRVRAREKNTLERYRRRGEDRIPRAKTTICQVHFSKNRHTEPFLCRKHVRCQNHIQKTKKKERHNSGKTVNSQKSIRTLPIPVAAAAASVLRPRHRSTDLSIFTPKSLQHMKQFLLLVLSALLSLSAGAQTRTFTDKLTVELGGKSGTTEPLTATVYLTEHDGKVDLE